MTISCGKSTGQLNTTYDPTLASKYDGCRGSSNIHSTRDELIKITTMSVNWTRSVPRIPAAFNVLGRHLGGKQLFLMFRSQMFLFWSYFYRPTVHHRFSVSPKFGCWPTYIYAIRWWSIQKVLFIDWGLFSFLSPQLVLRLRQGLSINIVSDELVKHANASMVHMQKVVVTLFAMEWDEYARTYSVLIESEIRSMHHWITLYLTSWTYFIPYRCVSIRQQ